MSTSSTQFTSFLNEKYIPLESRVKIFIAIGLLILPAVVFYVVFYQPKATIIQSLENTRTKSESSLALAKKKASNLEAFKKEADTAQLQFDIKAALLPKEKEIPKLLKDISALGSNAGLEFISFKPLGDRPKDFYSEIPVSIKVNGPYHNVGFFFDQISKLERIVSVTNVRMGGPKKEGGEMLLNSDCQLVTYRFTNVELPKDKK